MYETTQAFAASAISLGESRVAALELLEAALLIDIAAAVVHDMIPDARFLVRSAMDFDEALDWVQNSAEHGFALDKTSLTGTLNDTEKRFGAPNYLTEVGRDDSYTSALTGSGLLRPIGPDVEQAVALRCGVHFNDLIRIAHDFQFGASWRDVAEDPEKALRDLGWIRLLRSPTVVSWDSGGRQTWGRSEAEDTHLHWVTELLNERGPGLMYVESSLRDSDPRVRACLAMLPEEDIPWSSEGLELIPALRESAKEELRRSRVDLVEIEVRRLLDVLDVVGEPDGVVFGSPDDGRHEFDELLVPLRIVSGTLPLLDFFDADRNVPAGLGGSEWDLDDNPIVRCLSQIDLDRTTRVDGISVGDLRLDPVLVDQVAYSGLRLLRFNRG